MLTKIFMGKKANLVKFIWFVKYFLNVFVADVNLKINVFQIDMPPSFLLWRITSLVLSFCGVIVDSGFAFITLEISKLVLRLKFPARTVFNS